MRSKPFQTNTMLKRCCGLDSAGFSAAHPLLCWALCTMPISPTSTLWQLQSFQPACHRPKEISLYRCLFFKLLLITLVTVWSFSFHPILSKTKEHSKNQKAFSPLNWLIHRGTDWHSLGQSCGQNWSQGTLFTKPLTGTMLNSLVPCYQNCTKQG